MGIRIEKVVKPLQEMRRLVQSWPGDPTSDDVHRLRTVARKVEAVADLLRLHRQPDMAEVWRSADAVRRSAGKARALDVLAELGLALNRTTPDPSLERLMQCVKLMRGKAVEVLSIKLTRHRKRLEQGFARCEKRVRRSVEIAGGEDAALISGCETRLNKLAGRLSRLGRIQAENAHEFRIDVRKLRNMLDLYDDADAGVLKRLGLAKDAIGAWHDWQDLSNLAEKTLNSDADRACIERLQRITNGKLRKALRAANQLSGLNDRELTTSSRRAREKPAAAPANTRDRTSRLSSIA